MKKEFFLLFERAGYKNFRIRIIVAGIILLIAIISFTLLYYFLIPKSCYDLQCFTNSLKKCDRITWVKEDTKAAWFYYILGNNDKDTCNVEVKLLRMNQGTIDIENLEGSVMRCIVNKGDSRSPEDNMAKCTGELKEKLQEIIIERMHNYLLKNIGEIKETFNPAAQ